MQHVPLFGLLTTLVVYSCAYALNRFFGRCALLNPALISIATVIALLWALGISYDEYYATGARWLHECLGPVIVALAIPLYSQGKKLKTMRWPLLFALGVGSTAGIACGAYIGWHLRVTPDSVLALGAKSATVPIAIGLVEGAGGNAALAAVIAIGTGICGALCGLAVLRFLGVHDDGEKGFALGLSAHGIGTARAFLLSQEAGAFAGLGMALNGILTALLYPQLLEPLLV
ncbi:MAG TPA: LrgB family protein [Burkholderiales bacterium]|nr:LrgB family protein [Burkholderiales bacterium]